jgi:4-hydroxythreonine-4-phosphate dehydrogenase
MNSLNDKPCVALL